MSSLIRIMALMAILGYCLPASAKLEFDSTYNDVRIYGPYVKYNVLKPPYSFGRFKIDLNDMRFEKGQSPDGDLQIIAVWPRFLMDYGTIKIVNRSGRVLVEETFEAEQIGPDQKYANLILDESSEGLLKTLSEEFQFCITQEYDESNVKACSDFLIYDEPDFGNTFKEKNASSAKLNGKKAPKNAQISLAEKQTKLDIDLKFKSGFHIKIKDKIRQLDRKNVVIDPKEKRLGIVDGRGTVRPTQLTLKDRFFSFIKETNYYVNQYKGSKDWPEDLTDAEMEFSPYLVGASAQLWGLVLSKVPPPFDFKLNDDAPIATYRPHVELKGTKREDEVLAAKYENELFIANDQKSFLWKYPADKVGEMNQRYLSLQHKGEDYFFSQRIFRAHHGSISGSLAVSTSEVLDIVPGYNFSAEYWFEKLFSDASWSYQRWGIATNAYETVNGFKPSNDFNGKLSILPINFDILYRLTPGVRPVQSSFGIGLRYMNYTLFRSNAGTPDVNSNLLGIGAFWHTAPQKIIDDVFNIIPLFRYPKWIEASVFYYPMALGDVSLGFSFSWQVKGKLFFARHWYLESSININAIQLVAKTGTTTVEDLGLGTAHGTIGIGYLF